MEFVIESRSSGNQYIVGVFAENGKPVMTCTCRAGEMGNFCKHRFTLIDGDYTEVIRSTHDPKEITTALAGSDLSTSISQMRDQEQTVKAAQAQLKTIKKDIARLMNGSGRFTHTYQLSTDAKTEPKSEAVGTGTLVGMTVVFTGKLEQITRGEAKTSAEQNGAKVSGSISRNTDLLVVGSGAGSKAEKAENLGVRIITEADFLAMIEP